MPTILSIDPGQSTGYALWSKSSWAKLERPLAVGLLKPDDREDTWEFRCVDLGRQLDRLIRTREVAHIFCELPMFVDTEGGLAVAQKSLVKLCYLVGTYAGVALSGNRPFVPVPVAQWKGQTPKEVVNKRIEGRLGKKACAGYRADIWDAVGIGLWAKGYL